MDTDSLFSREKDSDFFITDFLFDGGAKKLKELI
jgi:hypothetical protein